MAAQVWRIRISDFGASIRVSRCDGKDLTEEDAAEIEKAVQKVRGLKDWRNTIGESFVCRISLYALQKGIRRDLDITLSEYWDEGIDEDVDEGGYGRSGEDIMSTDFPAAEAFATALKEELHAVSSGDRVVFVAGSSSVQVTQREGTENAVYELFMACDNW